jgi:hypothetical protein
MIFEESAKDGSPALCRVSLSAHRSSLVCSVLRLILAALLAGALCSAPAAQNGMPDQVNQRPQNPFGDIGNDDPLFAEKRLRALNQERQKNMVSDAAKLLKLATELNTEMGSADPPSSTPEQIRKLAEIEKLARSVKEKMSTSVGGEPTFREPPAPMIQ